MRGNRASRLSLTIVAWLMVFAGGPASAGPMDPTLAAADGYEGRIRLTRFLDEPDGYCLDVPGPVNARVKEAPLVAHTCHADALADQVFAFNTRSAGQIRWTHETTDLCFEALATDTGAKLDLRECADKPEQTFDYTARGEFQLRDTTLCIHVEKTGPAGPGVRAVDGQDAYGRGRSVNAQFTHLMRFLELRTCGTEDPAMSRWQATE
ncbi:MAG: ricin-type beta-trefoil lectin domain protein [Pseudomonadota bacterium]